MSNIRPSNLPIEETDLIGFVHTDRGIDGSAKFNLANVSSALNLDGMATQAPSNVAITGGAIDGTTIGATTPSTIAGTTGAFTSDTAGTILGVRNPAAGATKYTRFSLGNDSSATIAELYTFSSTYTPSAWEKPSGMGVFSSGSGGLSLVSQSGDVRILAGSLSTVHGLFTSTGLNSTAIGATTASTGAFTTLSASGGITNTQASTASINNVATGASSTSRYFASAPTTGTGYLLFTDTTLASNRGYVGYTFATDALDIATAGVVRGSFSSTGLAVTGALSATGEITANTNILLKSANDLRLYNAANDAFSQLYNPGGSGAHQLAVRLNGTNIGTFTSTGLAVTGALSATGYIVGAGTNPGGLGGSKWIYDWFGGNHRQFSETTGAQPAPLSTSKVFAAGSSGQITFYNGSSLNALINVARRGADNSGSIEIYTSNAGTLAERHASTAAATSASGRRVLLSNWMLWGRQNVHIYLLGILELMGGFTSAILQRLQKYIWTALEMVLFPLVMTLEPHSLLCRLIVQQNHQPTLGLLLQILE
jgi:hypothetical protein